MSASALHPDGLANSSGQVGRNYMRHTTGSVYARFDSPVRMYRGETMGGYYMETLSLGPAFLAAFVEPGSWGPDFAGLLDADENTAGMWIVGEDMPQESNRVTLNSQLKDKWGLPAADVHFDDHANDLAMREHGYQRADMIYEPVGAVGTHHTPPYPATHDLGTCRVSACPEDGVVDAFGQAHDVPGLFVSDGSVMTTGAAANPTLTIDALAIRQAEHIADQLGKGML